MQSNTIRVVCVDDHPDVAKSMARWINMQPDMRCIRTFGDAESLLAFLAATDPHSCPHVILLDWAMPGVPPRDALEFMTHHCKYLRVVVFTAHPSYEVEPEAREAGAAGYVCKTAEIATIIQAIRRVARGEYVAIT